MNIVRVASGLCQGCVRVVSACCVRVAAGLRLLIKGRVGAGGARALKCLMQVCCLMQVVSEPTTQQGDSTAQHSRGLWLFVLCSLSG
jgi:hypothetical protein